MSAAADAFGRFERAARELSLRAEGPACAYIYDVGALRRRARELVARLPEGCRLFYAMKANSDPVLLDALAPIVHGFEAASIGEIGQARARNARAVIFGGPGKTCAELERACAQRVELIHVESIHELYRLQRIAARLDRAISILLRINLRGPLPAATLQMAGAPTQFGVDEVELPRAMAALEGCANLELVGFHLHSLSNSLDAEVHLELVRRYLERAEIWQRTYGRRVRILNLGGGIGVDYAHPEREFDWPLFCSGLASLHGPAGPELVLECGRFVAAECGAYAVEVIDLKQNHGKAFAIVRGGTHHFRLPASWQHSHPFRIVPIETWRHPFERSELRETSVSVAGQLCTPKDLLARDAYVERLRIGDILLFTLAGAYGWSISHHDFLSHPHPEVIHVE